MLVSLEKNMTKVDIHICLGAWESKVSFVILTKDIH